MGHEYIKRPEVFSTTQNGAVPKVTADDVSNGKFLRADGTWAAALTNIYPFSIVDGKVNITWEE